MVEITCPILSSVQSLSRVQLIATPRVAALQVSHIAGEFFTVWATREAQVSLLQGVFPTQESNQGLLHGRQILYQLSYQGSPTQRLNFVQVNKEIQSETRNSVYQNELDECETIWMKLFSHLADDRTEVQIPMTFKGIIIIMDMG